MNIILAEEILLAGLSALAGMAAGGLAGYFIARRILTRNQRRKQDQREVVHSALEIFRPFHWAILHLAILTEKYRQNQNLVKEEKRIAETELSEAYSSALTSLLEEYKTLLENSKAHDFSKLNASLPVDLTGEILKIIRTLGEAGRLAQQESTIQECFQLVETAYQEASEVEKKLRTLYRKSY